MGCAHQLMAHPTTRIQGVAKIWEMKMTRIGLRVTLLFLVGSFFLAAALVVDGYVYANAKASAKGSTSVSVLKWGAVLASPSATPAKTPFVISWATSQNQQIAYLEVVNTGSQLISGQSYSIDTKDSEGSRKNDPSITFTACTSGVWNKDTDKCSGSTSVIGTRSNGTLTSNFSLAPLARLSLRLRLTKENRVAWTTTINMKINRSQIRTATTTNS